jgi:hypothetical protein
MRIILGAILSFFIWNLQSCKEVLPMRVITASVDSTFLTTNIPSPQSKVVLFEEYTGASCPNCPDGHKIVKEIQTQYGNKVVAVGLHPAGNVLAAPVHSAEDFRTEEAKLIGNNFGISSLPTGTFDRKSFDGSVVQGRFVWKQKLETALNGSVKVNASSKVYVDNLSGKKLLELEFTILEDIASDLNFSIMLMENKLDAPQKDGSEIRESYEHEHVLRKMYTNALGNALKKETVDGGGYKKGRVFLKKIEVEDFSKTKFKEENLYFVCFVSNAANSEVYQTTMSKVKN